MNRQKEHIDLLLRRIAVIAFFLIILFVSKNNDKNKLDSVENRIETVLKIENEAILVSPASFHCIDRFLVHCDLNKSFDYTNDNFVINQFNLKINIDLQTCEKRYTKIKPRIHYFNFPQVKTYVDNEETLLIS